MLTLPPLRGRRGAGTAKAMHSLAKEPGERQGSTWRWGNHKAKTAVAEGRDRAGVSPAELELHCNSRAAGRNRR